MTLNKKGRCNHRQGFTLLELLVVLALFFFFVLLIPWTFQAFALWGTLVTVFGVLTIFITIRKGWKASLIASIPTITFLIPFLLMIPTIYPMQLARLREAHYVDVQLVSILSDISAQKEGDPFWRFYVEDRDLAQSKVNLDIPEGCSLGEALNTISEKTNCDMKWYWHKGCGNEPSPSCACFCFFRHETDSKNLWHGKVSIAPNRVFGLEGESSLIQPAPRPAKEDALKNE